MTLTDYGFLRAAGASVPLKVADPAYNAGIIIDTMKRAEDEGAGLLVLPELCLTGYTCADLFFQAALLEGALAALERVLAETAPLGLAAVLGLPAAFGNSLFHFAAVIQKGRVLGLVPKSFLPGYGEFYEERWFSPAAAFAPASGKVTLLGREVPAGTDIIFRDGGGGAFTFAVELCEDLWTPAPPSADHAMHGADIIVNLSASNELIGKHIYRKTLVEQQSARCNAGYLYASAGMGESTQDLVFSGAGLIAENGVTLAETERFSLENQLIISEIDVEKLRAERIKNSNFNNSVSNIKYERTTFFLSDEGNEPFTLHRAVNPHPFVPPKEKMAENCGEIFNIQTGGLIKRWQHTQAQTMIIGVSGGLDSTLALIVAVKAADKLGYDRRRVVGVTMPGFGTTSRTYNNATALMQSLGVTAMEISIKAACEQHFKDIGQNPETHDVTYENSQARERTQILMDLANKMNGLVVGTGDLSELALGWATYNGDHISMYAVNTGVPKTLVRYLIDFAAATFDEKTARILRDIAATPVSPELLPTDHKGAMTQFTEDVVGPYELHDFFLYYFVRYGFTPEKILFLAKRAFVKSQDIENQGLYTDEEIEKWLRVFLRRFFQQQFKRSCLPDGPKVGSINLSPRGDWRMPSDAAGWGI